METHISEALDTARLNINTSPSLLSTATSLTLGVLKELRNSDDWGFDISDWDEAIDKLSGPLKEHLSDHIENHPEWVIHDLTSQHLIDEIGQDTWSGMSQEDQDEVWEKRAARIERNTWKGLSSGDQEEVWKELAYWLLQEVVH